MENINETLNQADNSALHKADVVRSEQLLTYTEWLKKRGLLNATVSKLIVKSYIGKQLPITDVVRGTITYSQYQDALKVVNEYKTQLEEHYKSVEKKVEGISKYANCNPDTYLYDTGCSVRLYNILIANEDKLGIETDSSIKLKDLNGLSMSKFLQCKNAGKKALEELKELCFYSGVKLSI